MTKLLSTIRDNVAQTVAGLPDHAGLCRALLRRGERQRGVNVDG